MIPQLPSFIGRSGRSGREKLGQAFLDYYDAGYVSEASNFIRRRYDVHVSRFGVSHRGMSKFDCSILMAVVMNTVYTLFWALVHVYRDQDLLKQLRNELEARCIEEVGPSLPNGAPAQSGQTPRRVRLLHKNLKSLDLMKSIIDETLRLYSYGAHARLVTADASVKIGSEVYKLRKGGLVLIPTSTFHHDTSIWGSDANTFVADRFSKANERKRSWHPAAYRPFGGGSIICPGRFFVTNEMMITIAMLALNFDTERVGRGGWSQALPNVLEKQFADSVLPPEKDFDVMFKPRHGWEAVKWV